MTERDTAMPPFAPESIDSMRRRFPAAVADVYAPFELVGARSPWAMADRRHVFDFRDGMRLIISTDRGPAGTTHLHVRTLWERGPMTRLELAEAIGMAWKGSRKSLAGNGPGGSYLPTLMRRGLVVSLGRIVQTGPKGKRKGRNVHLYSLPLTIQRRVAS